jgi:putative transposase
MCKTLEVSKSGYYDWINRKPSERKKFNNLLLYVIKEVYEESNEVYGSKRIHKEVLKRNYCCSARLVEKLMKMAKIRSKISSKFRVVTTDSKHNLPISKNILNREFEANAPNEKWVSDITYIKVGNNWMYLCIILDLFNREIVGWELSSSLETTLVVNAFEKAIQLHKPKAGLLFHSDRGVQYASQEFRSILEKHNMIQSMSRKGNCFR